ncbi:MAG: Gfo/Idh/MocA family oxidoreductase [Treponema sp.]|jgi:predicted dehydrogenase|nr:Gfo/Idh/MocA family oxidoreductase [Treponema sp.]
MKQLNIALIGQGRSGRDIHGKYILSAPERYRVAYVADLIPERRQKAEKEYACPAFADYRELFGRNDIDFVVNASFSHQHLPLSLDLLDHGFNVLCEKPFAHTAAQADQLIARQKKTGKMLAVFQQSRFAPYFEQVKKVIASGVLGRIVQIGIQFNGYARRWDWQTLQEYGGGSLYNTGPHPVDQALDLLDYRQGNPAVFCKMERVNTWGDAEDYVKLILSAPERPLIDVEISSCDAYPSFTYNVQGSSGGLKGDMKELKWRWFAPSESSRQELIREPLHDGDWNPLYCRETLPWREDSWKGSDTAVFNEAVAKLYAGVYDHLVNGKPLVPSLEQVRQQIWVMEEAHRQNPLPRIG